MTASLESLVRETLTDPRRRLEPDAQLYDRVLDRARALRRRHAAWWAGACAGMAAVFVIVLALSAAGPRPGPAPASPPAMSHGPAGAVEPITAVTGRVADLTRTDNALFLVESSPDLVLRMDPATDRITGSAPAPPGTTGIAVDPGAGRLWTWSSGGQSVPDTRMREYDLAQLTPLRDLSLPAREVFAGVMLDGSLWLTAQEGLYRVPAGAATAQLVPQARGGFGLAADPTRNRVIVAGDTMYAVDARSLQVVHAAGLGLFKPSVAVVAGRIWVGGYGSGEGSRLVRLDPGTLRPVGTSPANDDFGPGAIVWAGGGVVWARHGGDEGLDCLDPNDGRLLESWPAVQGPVSSAGGTGIAAHDSSAVWLTLNGRCTG